MSFSIPVRNAVRRGTQLVSKPRRFYSSGMGPHATGNAQSQALKYSAAALLGAGAVAGYALYQPNLSKVPVAYHADTPSGPRGLTSKVPDNAQGDAEIRHRMEAMIREQQSEIVAALEELDGTSFVRDSWERPHHGGGGVSCVLQDGKVFEKAGVNISIVNGTLPPAAVRSMRVNHAKLKPSEDGRDIRFFAAGLSMVLHPKNPMAPTVHLNYRYFETYDDAGNTQSWWFGGGTDLTPSYLFPEDAVHFHKTIKEECDKHDKSYYPRFKKWCDEYFWLSHRGEARGVGGIFFDDLDDRPREELLGFVTGALAAFLPSYLPIMAKRKDMPYNLHQKEWQQLRRGRYVEFNLIHDRGTAFGLKTPGARVESILMSLPLTAAWKYMHEPTAGSPEAQLVDVLKNPRDWI